MTMCCGGLKGHGQILFPVVDYVPKPRSKIQNSKIQNSKKLKCFLNMTHLSMTIDDDDRDHNIIITRLCRVDMCINIIGHRDQSLTLTLKVMVQTLSSCDDESQL